MQNVIVPEVLFSWMSSGDFTGKWLGPYLDLHSKSGARSGRWPWTKPNLLEKLLDHTWDLLGAWQARRAVKVDRDLFDAVVPVEVRKVATCLNDHKVASLADFGTLRQGDYEDVLGVIQGSVLEISRVKPTKTVRPMFGSKVLHHYFPSVVPVFDDAMVMKGAMLLPCFQDFVRSSDDGWIFWHTPEDAGSAGSLDFHRWFAFLGKQTAHADPEALSAARREMGNLLVNHVPKKMVEDDSSVLWHLNAKVAEFCATGEAAEQGLLT